MVCFYSFLILMFEYQGVRDGNGVVKDLKKLYVYSLASDKGYSKAQSALGLCYENGNGVARNMIEEVRLYIDLLLIKIILLYYICSRIML